MFLNLGYQGVNARGEKKAMPSTRVERVTFPLQVERATTTPTRHYDSKSLTTRMIAAPYKGIGDQN